MDYVKLISVQELTAAALAKLTPAIATLARAEGLEAHARSVEVRSVAQASWPAIKPSKQARRPALR
jgi:histidinol dehydrogenase